MNRVLLVNPDSPFLVDSRTFPPLGLLYLGAALEHAGHEAAFADMAWDDPLGGHNPDLIGIMCLTPHFPKLKHLIDSLRRIYAGVPIGVGGPHFSTRADDYQRVGADAVCVGDGEEMIVSWATFAPRARMRGKWHSDGLIVNVDDVPVPARHLTDVHRYRYRIAGLPATTIITQRGCPYECTFCCHWEGYRKMRLRALGNVATELAQLEAAGFGAVMIYDDEVNIVRKRTLALAEVLKSSGLRWRAFIKANLFDEEQARAFADSGCWELCTGVESGSDVVLKTIAKKATVADNTRARALCREHGIRFKAFCMVGHPGETLETVEATKRWLIENAPDEFNLSLYTPYLGTPVTDRPSDFDVEFSLHYDQEEFFYRGRPGEYQPNASTSQLSAGDLARLRDKVEDEVREALGLPKQGSPDAYYSARTPD